jgi:hypothetical protein
VGIQVGAGHLRKWEGNSVPFVIDLLTETSGVKKNVAVLSKKNLPQMDG